jgi:FixJ family two-component response regulator
MPSEKSRIVVVDDHAGVRKTIKRILKAGGFTVVLFDSAEAALEADAAASADCLVLDVNLSGQSGFELYQQLAASGKERPTIFITAADEPAVRKEAEKLGGVGSYLAKPFLASDLLDAVARALRRP